MNEKILVTCESAPNIALIKYWGKKNESLILPLNGSISITLDKNVLCTKTSILLRKSSLNSSKKIQLCLNGSKQEFDDNELSSQHSKEDDLLNRKRFFTMLNKVRENCAISEPYTYEIRIATFNNFPTACGLASSASGLACMAQCLAAAFDYKGDVSELARLGSGSACRSCFGGFVKWNSDDQSKKSIASALFSSKHWPELNVLVLILEDEKKKVSSTNGMQISVKTSDLLRYRVKLVEEERLNEMYSSIEKKDFSGVGKLAMRDSNCFHAICMDTYPPLFYLNDKSKELIRLIDEYNKFEQIEAENLKVFYSFDAGPNAFLFALDEHLNELIYLINLVYFAELDHNEFLNTFLIRNLSIKISEIDSKRKVIIKEYFKKFIYEKENIFMKYLIHSKVGDDPIIIYDDWSKSLFENEEIKIINI